LQSVAECCSVLQCSSVGWQRFTCNCSVAVCDACGVTRVPSIANISADVYACNPITHMHTCITYHISSQDLRMYESVCGVWGIRIYALNTCIYTRITCGNTYTYTCTYTCIMGVSPPYPINKHPHTHCSNFCSNTPPPQHNHTHTVAYLAAAFSDASSALAAAALDAAKSACTLLSSMELLSLPAAAL